MSRIQRILGFKSLFCVRSLQLNELVIGDNSGKLLVYKNDDSKPWITRTCVGMVSTEPHWSLLTPLLCNTSQSSSWPALPLETSATGGRWGKRTEAGWCRAGLGLTNASCSCQNLVVAMTAEGWFHLFDLTAASVGKSDSSSQHEFLSSDEQRPFFTQHIPANTKVILISDIGAALPSVARLPRSNSPVFMSSGCHGDLIQVCFSRTSMQDAGSERY